MRKAFIAKPFSYKEKCFTPKEQFVARFLFGLKDFFLSTMLHIVTQTKTTFLLICQKKKGFIAAPLIGTIIFVTAVVFVVNINKAESNSITQIAQESYHNRVNSIVELYRADAGSLFREDVKKVVEQALTSQCWTLFNTRVGNDPNDDANQRRRNLQEARYNSCKQIKSTILSVICSNTGEASGTQCANQCAVPGASPAAYATCLASCPASRTYGLQNFLDNINQEFNFEGMTLSPSNQERFESFFRPVSGGQPDLQQYIGNCRSLMKELTMDCNAFAGTDAAEPTLQCCKRDTSTGEYPGTLCPADDVVPGCESGIFYVRVVPGDVFESIPRIQARDDAGNYLRAGALGESEEFFLPITFPLMRYLDSSYNAYSRLAFGSQIGENDGEGEGVLDGICLAGSACTDPAQLGTDPGFTQASGTAAPTSADEAERQLVDSFYTNVFIPAFEDAMPQSSKLSIQVLDFSEEPKGSCSSANGAFTCESTAEEELKRQIEFAIRSHPVGGGRAAYVGDDMRLKFKVIDLDESFRVKKDELNEFCTTHILEYNT